MQERSGLVSEWVSGGTIRHRPHVHNYDLFDALLHCVLDYPLQV